MDNQPQKSLAIFSGFVLKIIAFATMTLDHIGWLLQEHYSYTFVPGTILRCVGRIALPIICFLIAEGFAHTKKPGNYFLRLGIMGTIIAVALIVVEYAPIFGSLSLRAQGNIYMDLLLGGLGVFLLRRKETYLKALAVIPFAIGLTSFIIQGIEHDGLIVINWFPFFLRPQYGFYSVGMTISFELGKTLKKMFIQQYSDKTGIPVESVEDTNIDKTAGNLINMGIIIFWTLLFLLMAYIVPEEWLFWNPFTQTFAVLAGALVLLYNGRRGYNAKWFQYGSYLYYPLHLLVIFGIGLLIFG